MHIATGEDLPPELIYSILLRCRDWDRDLKPTKRGLAACSLTCRFCARLIRPLLFERLVLRNATDVSRLLVYLDEPDILVPNIRDCVSHVGFVEDQTTSNIPWSHHVIRLHGQRPQLTFSSEMSWILISESQIQPQPTTLLPFSALPRTLPGPTLLIGHLNLRRLRLSSVKGLVDCAIHLGMMEISLEEVAFVDSAVHTPVPRRSRRHSRLQIVHMNRCFDEPELCSQYKLANILLTSRGKMRIDDRIASISGRTLLALSPNGHPAQVDLRYNAFDSTELCTSISL